MTTYNEMQSNLDNCQTFKGNSVTAKTEDGLYNVYSYVTLIFSFDIGKQEVVKFDNSFYSSTTSKIQNLIIKAYKLNEGKLSRTN